MFIKQINSIAEVSVGAWNRLVQDKDPFVSHEFLSALELSGSVCAETGWLPRHILVYRQQQLIAAMPLYLKDHSWGEYVFDQQWADAYYQSGMDYYPKWLNAVPFTPCQGQRLLIDQGEDIMAVIRLCLDHIQRLSERKNISSLHSLFPNRTQMEELKQQLLIREGVQFHWFNRGYRDFTDYLQSFTARQRKNINKERRKIAEQGIELVRLTGAEIFERHWQVFFGFYQRTYLKKGQYPYLNEDFFQRLSQTMTEQILLVLALKGQQPVGAALSLIGGNTLYGRYWGCQQEYDGLHFEACYYQGLEFCLDRGLKRFDSGAQGEHKISRGFEPVMTYSAHWIQNPRFSSLIADFLRRERPLMRQYLQDCRSLLPFKIDDR
ncbi:GNAT family N-acetyltransferase [Methylomarinum sp. Ch1-1]|uniref:GNAT family N-acetyltransferase n=1 Tax=Methylomarinum roseum TaxID=3067653 RepID=A0AAU7NS01_9GAMM